MVESRVLHPNIQLIDLTKQFHESAQRLPPGQLVKDEHFTLFEAVGALEIGDPKMDSGCLEDGEDLEDDFDFSAPLSASQIIWLMDELICREVAWHQGYPLSQTLFTSVHIDQLLWPEPKQLSNATFRKASTFPEPDLLENALRVYCLGLIKCCDLVHRLITNHHYYEEEDFATHLFNRELLRPFPSDEILILLRGVEKDLRAIPATQDVTALLCRLSFRIEFLTILNQCIESIEPSSLTISNALSHVDDITKSFSQSIYTPNTLVKGAFSTKIQRHLASSVPPRPMIVIPLSISLTFIRTLIAHVCSSYELFRITHPRDLITAYNTFMSQQPTPSVFIRCLLQSFLSVNSLVLARHHPQTFLLTYIQSSVLPLPNPLLDPSYIHIEFPSDPRFQIHQRLQRFLAKTEPLFTSHYRTICQNRSRLRRLLCHSILDLDGLQADAEEMDLTLQTIAREAPAPYPPSAINEGDTETSEAPPQRDLEYTYAYPLSSFIYLLKLQQMQDIILLGFELEVYAAHEYAEMYAYLAHICGLTEGHLERISHFVSHSQDSYGRFGGSQETGWWNHPGSSRRNREREGEEQRQESLRLLYRLFLNAKATDLLASTLHRLYIVLRRHGHFCSPSDFSPAAVSNNSSHRRTNQGVTNNRAATVEPAGDDSRQAPANTLPKVSPYSTDKLRTDLRLLPFFSLSIPEPLSHAELSHLTNLDHLSDGDVLHEAGKLGQEARRTWEDVLRLGFTFARTEVEGDDRKGREGTSESNGKEKASEGVLEIHWKNDIRGSIKSCIAAGVAVSVLSRGIQGSGGQQNAGKKRRGVEHGEAVLRDPNISIPSPGQDGRWHLFWAVPKIQR